jgi:hypothetical protein
MPREKRQIKWKIKPQPKLKLRNKKLSALNPNLT